MTYCACCGIEFTPDNEHPYQKFYNEEHRKRFYHKEERAFRTEQAKANREQIACLICGTMFTPTKYHRLCCSSMCSEKAHKAGKEREREARPKASPKKRICKWCGAEFEAIGKKVYCCRNHWHFAIYGREEAQQMTKSCEWCGSEFATMHSDARACPKHAKRLAKWERKQRMRAVIHVPYSRYEIFQRDEFTCHICGTPIDMDAVAPMPYSPSIDHVIPVKHGGADAPYNIKAAHFICNSLKSDRLVQ